MSEAPPVRAGDAPPVRAQGLVKRYKEVLAVDHIDLNVDAGDVYGFLGPNGAGKTTTLRMCLGLIVPSEGTVELFGRDPMRAGARRAGGRGGVRGGAALLPVPDGSQEPRAARGARRRRRARADRGGAGHRRARPARAGIAWAGYSHGMRQRLGIAAALLRRPRLLLLDEPATGLDPAGMRDMRALIRRLADEGITVLLSSHQLPEVQELCDRVAIVLLRARRLRGRAQRPAPPGRGGLPPAHDRRHARAGDRRGPAGRRARGERRARPELPGAGAGRRRADARVGAPRASGSWR